MNLRNRTLLQYRPNTVRPRCTARIQTGPIRSKKSLNLVAPRLLFENSTSSHRKAGKTRRFNALIDKRKRPLLHDHRRHGRCICGLLVDRSFRYFRQRLELGAEDRPRGRANSDTVADAVHARRPEKALSDPGTDGLAKPKPDVVSLVD